MGIWVLTSIRDPVVITFEIKYPWVCDSLQDALLSELMLPHDESLVLKNV